MRTRTGLTPDAWRDDGPQSAMLLSKPYSAVHADNVGNMRPVLNYGGNSQEATSSGAVKAFSLHTENRLRGEKLAEKLYRPICGAAMMYDETCGRTKGHRPSHRSRTIMDADAARRRPRSHPETLA